jgi:hypothetical protein
MVRVEVIEIQICFVIYKIDLKKKNDFLFKIGIWAESTARPSRPHSARGLRVPADWCRGPTYSRACTA